MMIRTRPLETEQVTIRAKTLTVPTLPETLRVKGWLAVRRNQTRDYIDIAALSDKLGIGESAQVLAAVRGPVASDAPPSGTHAARGR